MDATDPNDNAPARAGLVPIIGFIAGDGEVTITDPTWRPNPEAAGDDAA